MDIYNNYFNYKNDLNGRMITVIVEVKWLGGKFSVSLIINHCQVHWLMHMFDSIKSHKNPYFDRC